MKAKMMAEPDNPEPVMRLLIHLQCDGAPRGRIVEAYQLCLRRQRDWRWSEDWQAAVLELCLNYQVRNCHNDDADAAGFVPLPTYQLWVKMSTSTMQPEVLSK